MKKKEILDSDSQEINWALTVRKCDELPRDQRHKFVSFSLFGIVQVSIDFLSQDLRRTFLRWWKSGRSCWQTFKDWYKYAVGRYRYE